MLKHNKKYGTTFFNEKMRINAPIKKYVINPLKFNNALMGLVNNIP